MCAHIKELKQAQLCSIELGSTNATVSNSVQITEELWTTSFDNTLTETKTGICNSLKFDSYFRLC